ncbi:hypothetical protein [Actinoplanes regularis]|uniref:Uncharacterized protein n=1 Tax=Actinoplanes regularis TaxID=52697 RepID=A0A239CPY7_9ACTN|nr:hypothetical protein [Actinoplanes regularis]GIE88666.1 hypothetical protein Are01nite_51460 [Actinoplanes regularis]SNS21574.1 hypothetical protein SAMN06264365_1122 [Actinoplanes regularis]
MSTIPVEIISRPPMAGNAAKQFTSKREPAGVIITQIDALTMGNERGCGDDNPYN